MRPRRQLSPGFPSFPGGGRPGGSGGPGGSRGNNGRGGGGVDQGSGSGESNNNAAIAAQTYVLLPALEELSAFMRRQLNYERGCK